MKMIPYDYLYGRRSIFPFTYKLIYLKILDEAPSVPDSYDSGYRDGYEAGLAEAGLMKAFDVKHDQEHD